MDIPTNLGGKAPSISLRCTIPVKFYVNLIMNYIKVYCLHKLYSTDNWKDNKIKNPF